MLTNVTKFLFEKYVGHLKDRLLLGGAILYIRLFCLPCHSHITAIALCKQVPACIRNIV